MQIDFGCVITKVAAEFFDNIMFFWRAVCTIGPVAMLCAWSSVLAQADSVAVTFFYAPSGNPGVVFVPGEFNNWGPNNNGVIAAGAPSKMNFDSVLRRWRKTVRLRLGGKPGGGVPGAYQYKFNENGTSNGWLSDPLNPRRNAADHDNSYLHIRNPTIHYLLPNVLSPAVKTRFPEITTYIFPTTTGAIDTASIRIKIDDIEYARLGSRYDPATCKLSFVPTVALGDGTHQLRLSVRSALGTLNADSTSFAVQGDAVQIVTRPATTRKTSWRIRGEIYKADGSLDNETRQAVLRRGGESWPVSVGSGRIDTTISVVEGANAFSIEATLNDRIQRSAPVTITRIVNHAPYAVIEFDTIDGKLRLKAGSSSDPDGQNLAFVWDEDKTNPAAIGVAGFTDSALEIPSPATPGEYYFTLRATDPDGNADVTRNYITVLPDGQVVPATLASNPGWVKRAVVYEIFPFIFTRTGTIAEMELLLPYTNAMGCNVLWLTPVMKNRGGINAVGGGYDIEDFYEVDSNYGTLHDMRDFVAAAHDLGMKVVLDITPNHVSEAHPWVQDARLYRQNSAYWDYLEHRLISHDTNGLGQSYSTDGVYVHYSNWTLANLNSADLDCQQELINVFKFWLMDVGADGFRFDVYWGPSRRYGERAFWRPVREALKHVKPDIWLLAEAAGVGIGSERIYADHGGGADAGYDWNLLGTWPSVFNALNVGALHNTIFNNNYYPGPNSFFFRFLENHDEWRVAQRYKPVERSLPGAAVLMTVPGIPMIYAGQELGFGDQFEYQDGNDGLRFLGNRSKIDLNHPSRVKSQSFYQRLAHIRTTFPAFWTQSLKRMNQSDNDVYVFVRPFTDENAVVAANFGNTPRTATITLNGATVEFSGGVQPSMNYHVSEMLTGSRTIIEGDASGSASFPVNLPAYGSAVYLVSTEPESIVVPDLPSDVAEGNVLDLPGRFVLHQNYPNPFNPTTAFRFDLPVASEVSAQIVNVLGGEVVLLGAQRLPAGQHVWRWDGVDRHGRTAASGVYFLRVTAGSQVAVRKMVLLR